METKKNRAAQCTFYFVGLLIMTLGVAVSVKSELGVSPVSSVPYTMTVVSGVELGITTAIFSIIAALCQIPVLRKKYRKIDILQIPIGLVFGVFMTACVKLVRLIPDPQNFGVKFIMMLISTVIVSIGVFLYISSGFIPLPTEGFVLAVTKVTKYSFGTLKVVGDVTMVAISLITCLIALHAPGSIGIGTVVSAILIGNEVKVLGKFFGKAVNQAMGIDPVMEQAPEEDQEQLPETIPAAE